MQVQNFQVLVHAVPSVSFSVSFYTALKTTRSSSKACKVREFRACIHQESLTWVDTITRPKQHELQNCPGLISNRWPDLFDPLSHDKHMGCFRLVLQLLSSVSSVSPLWQSRLTMLTMLTCGASAAWATTLVVFLCILCILCICALMCTASLLSIAQSNGLQCWSKSQNSRPCLARRTMFHPSKEPAVFHPSRIYGRSQPENAKWTWEIQLDMPVYTVNYWEQEIEVIQSDSCGQTWDLDAVCKIQKFDRRSHWRRWHFSHVPICKGFQGRET